MFLQNIRIFPETFLNRSFTDEFIWFIKVTFNSNVTCFFNVFVKIFALKIQQTQSFSFTHFFLYHYLIQRKLAVPQ